MESSGNMTRFFVFCIVLALFPSAAHASKFEVDNCIRMDVDGTITIDAVKDNQTEFSFKVDLSDTPFTITEGDKCSKEDTSRSMKVQLNQTDSVLNWVLFFTTARNDLRSTMDQLLKFTPSALFRNNTLSDELVTIDDTGNLVLSLLNASYRCQAEQSIQFNSVSAGGYDFKVSQAIRSLHVQPFNLESGNNFSPEPVTTESTSQPVTTTPTPDVENTYVVENKYKNVTCIVLRGDITFRYIQYNTTSGKQAIADPITIPRMNATSGNVKTSGSCGDGSGPEQLIITFNKEWNLTLTFTRGSELTAEKGTEEYSLQDIKFDYVWSPEFFPNASNSDTRHTGRAQNLTGFLQGSVDGGSYKCDAKITQALDNGVLMETTNLQYKAFNYDASVKFNDNVAECPADENKTNVIPIVVGAALGGLVIIVALAYVISRQRHRRTGYEAL
ncbi:lysosome-associated membrane glycoprotein 1-like isoform X2 [Babylonia areolata]|uniref:lysosome-associated membrane glycoprotein 1-like isoform X2 n=1 Tax=Babylonia areolata TaxID=304850 RepID=UPI003FD3115B